MQCKFMPICGAGVIRENITLIKKDPSFKEKFCLTGEEPLACPHFSGRQEKEEGENIIEEV